MRHPGLVMVFVLLMAYWFDSTASFSLTTTTTTTTTSRPETSRPKTFPARRRVYTRTGTSAGTSTSTSTTQLSTAKKSTSTSGTKRPRPVFLTHERDFFRQEARLNSMESYVLVSALTASMSFGCLVGFVPHLKLVASHFVYRSLFLAIQVVSGLSALFGLYATTIFSLTILYGKSALGAERDREYDKFLRATIRARVNAARCFSLSLGTFALLNILILLERIYPRFTCAVPIVGTSTVLLYYLYRDWRLLVQSKELVFKD